MATFTGGLELALATLQTVTNTDFSGRVQFYYFFFHGGDQRVLILKERGQGHWQSPEPNY